MSNILGNRLYIQNLIRDSFEQKLNDNHTWWRYIWYISYDIYDISVAMEIGAKEEQSLTIFAHQMVTALHSSTKANRGASE